MDGSNEKTNTKKEDTTAANTTSKTPLLDEATARAERLEKAAAEAKFQADRLEALRAQELLSGSGGIRPEIKPKEETPREYRKRIEKELAAGTAGSVKNNDQE